MEEPVVTSESIVYCSFTAGWELRPIKAPAHCQRGTKFIRLAYFRNIRLSSSTLERQVVLPYGPPTGTVLSHTHSSSDRERSSWLRHAIAMTGTCRNLLNATSSTADWLILGSLLWRSSLNKLCGRPPQYAHAPCKLTFDFLTLKVVSESNVTWVTSVSILVFLGLSILDLGPMYATDVIQTSDRRRTSDAHHHLMSPLWGRGHNKELSTMVNGNFLT